MCNNKIKLDFINKIILRTDKTFFTSFVSLSSSSLYFRGEYKREPFKDMSEVSFRSLLARRKTFKGEIVEYRNLKELDTSRRVINNIWLFALGTKAAKEHLYSKVYYAAIDADFEEDCEK